MTSRIILTVRSVGVLTLLLALQGQAHGQTGEFSPADDATRIEVCEVSDAQIVVRDAADDAWKSMVGEGCGGNGQVPCYRTLRCFYNLCACGEQGDDH